MLDIKYIKADPSTYLLKYTNGRIVKEGLGRSVFYSTSFSSIVSIPVNSEEVSLMFSTLTADFQEVTIQGQITYKIIEPRTIAKIFNYTLDMHGRYLSEDPQKLSLRITNLVQVAVGREVEKLALGEAIIETEMVAASAQVQLVSLDAIKSLGIKIIDFSIIAIKPNQETARALEANARELFLRKADEAIYLRRNAAIEQERVIKENELQTEIAIKEKQRDITRADMEEQILLEKKKESLVTLATQNSKKEAQARAYAIDASLEAIRKTDPKILQVLATVGMEPAQLIANAFHGLSENAEKIGQLNVTPDLLTQLIDKPHE